MQHANILFACDALVVARRKCELRGSPLHLSRAKASPVPRQSITMRVSPPLCSNRYSVSHAIDGHLLRFLACRTAQNQRRSKAGIDKALHPKLNDDETPHHNDAQRKRCHPNIYIPLVQRTHLGLAATVPNQARLCLYPAFLALERTISRGDDLNEHALRRCIGNSGSRTTRTTAENRRGWYCT